jgi:hypothetical protein
VDANSSGTPYEVHCERCRVTFPLGTRRCIHCGETIGRRRRRARFLIPPGHEEILVDEDLPEKTRGFSPMTFVWVLLLLGGSLYRSCGGG